MWQCTFIHCDFPTQVVISKQRAQRACFIYAEFTSMAEILEKVKDYTTSADINRALLMDKLSEFLAVEKGGVKLYEVAIQQVRNPDVLNRFRGF